MSLLINQSYANPSRPLWLSVDASGGGGGGSYPLDASFNTVGFNPAQPSYGTLSSVLTSGFEPFNGDNVVAVTEWADNLGPLQTGGYVEVQQTGPVTTAYPRTRYGYVGITYQQPNSGTSVPFMTIDTSNNNFNLSNVATINGSPPGGGGVLSQTLLGVFASGSNEGAAPFTGSYFTRVLNTGSPALSGSNSTTISGMSLSGNTITLPAGTYQVSAGAPCFGVYRHKARLYNTTASSVTLQGQSFYADDPGQVQTNSMISGMFTIGSPATFELQHRVESTGTPSLALGVPSNFGDNEVFSMITFSKIA